MFPRYCNTHAYTTMPGSSITIKACFFKQIENFWIMGCRLSSAERNFFLEIWLLSSFPKAPCKVQVFSFIFYRNRCEAQRCLCVQNFLRVMNVVSTLI